MGRAVSEEQEGKYGKWWTYGGFQKTLELYNINNVLLDDNAINQAKEREVVLIVEGCFDVAKLVEAGIYNVVASFGAYLAEEQIPKVKRLRDRLGVKKFLVWYDRDKAGRTGQEKAVRLLRDSGFEAKGFVWDREFRSAERGAVGIPKGIKDVCDFSVDQIEFLKRSF
jgi:DNA primase